MSGRVRFLLVAFIAAASSTPSLAQDTLKKGDVLSGKLRVVHVRHPNGTPLTAYQLVVDKPRELAEKDEFCDGPPKVFHLMVDDKTQKVSQLTPLLGKKVSLVAADFFCSETAWHIGDVVIGEWRIVNKPAR